MKKIKRPARKVKSKVLSPRLLWKVLSTAHSGVLSTYHIDDIKYKRDCLIISHLREYDADWNGKPFRTEFMWRITPLANGKYRVEQGEFFHHYEQELWSKWPSTYDTLDELVEQEFGIELT